MAIDYSDPNKLMNNGQQIAINDQSKYDAALKQAQGAYQGSGINWGSGELNDFENRVRGGQSLDQILANTRDDAARRGNSQQAGTQQDAQSNQGVQPQSVTQSWNNSGSQAQNNVNPMIQEMLDRQKAQDAQNRQRGDSLFSQLQGRAQQGLNVDPNNPVLKAQTDAYRAEQERARRNFISDTAEQGNPLANMTGERRMAAERVGQNVGGFQAELMGRELQSRRDEIQQALTGMGQLLTADQANELQRQLGLLDNSIAQQGLGIQARGQDLNNSQFLKNLGLQAEDRSSYWDAVRSGVL